MPRTFALAVTLALFAGPAPTQQFKAGDITIDEAWSRATPKGADVAVDQRLIEGAAFMDLHVGPDDLLIDVGGADKSDRDGAHFGGRRHRLVRGLRRPPECPRSQQPKYE